MDTLLTWQSLVFYIPVAFGALLALGAALGLAAAAAGAEGHGGGDSPDGGASDGDGDPGAGLSLLDLGKLPLTLRLMLLAFSFGGVGLVLGPVIRSWLPGAPALAGALALAGAAAGAVLIGGGTARLLVRHLPLLETETIRRADLVGATGRLILRASERVGVAQVRDRRGNLHQVACRLQPGERPLPARTEVLLVEYDEATNVFLVARNPLADGGRAPPSEEITSSS